MSGDLRQYFSEHEVNFSAGSPERMIETVIGYQEDAAEINGYLEDQIEYVADFLNDDICEIEYMDLHFFCDILGKDIYHYIFSSFLDKNDFKIIDMDTTMDTLYDEFMEQFININGTVSLKHKVRGFVERFYQEAQEECIVIKNGKAWYDDYLCATLGFKLVWVDIKNKHKARILRKNYAKRGWFYRLCRELCIVMENGQFVFLECTWLECEGYYEEIVDFETVSDAVAELNRLLGTGRKLNRETGNVLNMALDTDTDGIIGECLAALSTESEVII